MPAADPAQLELEKRLAYLEQTLERARVEGHVPGMAIAVVDDGELIWAHGFGVSDLDANTPVTPDTVFAIGSSTKAFSATLAAMMVDEGQLAWDDPTSKWLPDFALKIDGKEGEVATVRDMLAHRCGFARSDVLWAANKLSREQVLAYAAKAEPMTKFRAEFHYNNVIFMAGSLTAAKAADSSWEELLRTRLLEPLQMQHTSVDHASSLANPALSKGYSWREDLQVFEPEQLRNIDAIAPAGGIYSSVLDMSNWLRFQLAEGEFAGQRLIGADALAQTHTQQIEIAPGIGYGMGWMLREWNGKRVIEHGGNIDGFAATVAMLPEEELGFVLLTNVGITPLQSTSINLVFDALLAELPSGEAGEDLSRFVGEYLSEIPGFGGENFEVLIKDGKLAVDVPGQTVYLLKPPDPDDDEALREFEVTDTIAVSFDEGPDGEIIALRLHQSGMKFELLRKGVELEPEVTPGEVAALLGHYRAENGMTIEVLIHNGRLAVDVPGQMIYDFELPTENGEYRFRMNHDFVVSFTRGKNGEVEKLSMAQPGGGGVFVREAKGPSESVSLDELHRVRKSDKRAKAIAKAGIVHVRQRIEMPSAGLFDGNIDTWFDADGHLRQQTSFGPVGDMLAVLDGAGGWTESSFDPLEATSGVALLQAKLAHPRTMWGDWRPYVGGETLLRSTTEDGRTIHIVELRPEGLPAYTMHVDGKTGDVIQVDYVEVTAEGLRFPVLFKLSDYRVVQGMRVPYRIESSNPHTGKTIVTVLAVETKVAADPARFAPMPTSE